MPHRKYYYLQEKYPHENKCPASDKKCNYCHKIGHFEKCCHSKSRDNSKSKEKSQIKQTFKKDKQKSYAVQMDQLDNVEHNSDSDTSEEYAFFVGKETVTKIPSVNIKLGINSVSAIIDTGSSINLMGMDVYENLSEKPELKTNNLPHVYAYGESKHMKIRGKFHVPIHHKNNKSDVTFYVSENPGDILLSYATSRELGMINIINNIDCNTTEQIVEEFQDRFVSLGKLNDSTTHLHEDENIPAEQNPHVRIPFLMRKSVDKELERLLDADAIEPVEGEATPWVSPIHVVKKPRSDNIRICVDIRAPNKAIKRERHIVPTVDDIITSLNGSSHFSKLDLNQGYHQLELDESSRKFTVFSTHRGLFRYKRLNFGVNAAAEIFQNRIRKSLEGLEGVLNISDDLLVYGTSQEEHDMRLRAVLERLREKNLTLNREKCRFNKTRVEFYGHIFSDQGISPDPKKVSALQNAEQPGSVKEVRSFIGLAQYCSRFIPDLATKTEPLRRLTKARTKWAWEQDQQKAFDIIKQSITEDCTNAYFSLEKQTELIVDASPIGLGAILAQKDENGELRIIAMASRALTPTEQRYSQIERESLAIAWGIKHFHLYLFANNFTVVTDHRRLVHLFNDTHSKPSTRIQRWMMNIQEYDFIVLRTGKWYEVIKDNPEHESELRRLYLLRNELSAHELDLLLRGNRIIIPTSLRMRIIHIAHEGHQGLVRTKSLLRQKVWFSGIDALVQKVVGECPQCQLVTVENVRKPLKMSKIPDGPWIELSCDLMDLPNGKYVLILVDDYSRYPLVEILNSATSRAVIQSLDNMLSMFGTPKKIRTDNGPCFISKEFREFSKYIGFKHRKVTPRWPRANGEAERMVRTLKKFLRICRSENRSFTQALHRFLRNYRATPHPSTGETPATLIFGHPMRTRLPEVTEITPNQEVIDRDTHQKEIMKDNAESRLKLVTEESQLQIGDTILLRREGIVPKELTPYDPDLFKVIAKNGPMITASRNEQNVTRNSSRFKRINFELLARDEDHIEIMVMETDRTSLNQLPRADSVNLPEKSSLDLPVNDPVNNYQN